MIAQIVGDGTIGGDHRRVDIGEDLQQIEPAQWSSGGEDDGRPMVGGGEHGVGVELRGPLIGSQEGVVQVSGDKRERGHQSLPLGCSSGLPDELGRPSCGSPLEVGVGEADPSLGEELDSGRELCASLGCGLGEDEPLPPDDGDCCELDGEDVDELELFDVGTGGGGGVGGTFWNSRTAMSSPNPAMTRVSSQATTVVDQPAWS